LKYFDTVAREIPLAAENSSIVLTLGRDFSPRFFSLSVDTSGPSSTIRPTGTHDSKQPRIRRRGNPLRP
jgi:hypothetical protein